MLSTALRRCPYIYEIHARIQDSMVNVAIYVAMITIQPREESCEGVVNNNINSKSLGVVGEDDRYCKNIYSRNLQRSIFKNITT